MSDDEFYYDDEEYLDLEDFPFNEAEDLAAHTIQSPVLVNYDPSWETASNPSEWEYYSDEYWEEEPAKKRKPRDDDIGSAEATGALESVRKKRRKTNSSGIPDLSLGEPSLAGSTVVWKSKEETLKPHEDPIVNDGQGEKVSILTDWKERFEIPTTTGSNAGQRRVKQETSIMDAGDVSSLGYQEDYLPAPPTTLEELKGLPPRSLAIPPPLPEIPSRTNAMAPFPSFEEGPYSDEDVSESEDVVKSCGSQRVVAVELPSRNAVIMPPSTGMTGRSKDQKKSNKTKENGDQHDQSVCTRTAKKSGKRKLVNESSPSHTATDVLDGPGQRGRSKRRRTSKTRGRSQLDSEAPTQVEAHTRKRGRPKKQKSSPSNKDISMSDVGKPAAPRRKKQLDSTHNAPIKPAPVDGNASIRGKRKVSDSEDELSMPAPKRQINAIKGPRAPAASSAKEPVARRSVRKK